MQILRIILMVCFVFTAYTPIGEAVDIEAVDISKGSKKKSSSRAELPLGVEDVGAFESKENLEDVITLKGNEVIELEAGFEYKDSGSTEDNYPSGRFDNKKEEGSGAFEELNLQLQKESLTTPNENRDIKPEPHLNERILQLQKESLATPTEDDLEISLGGDDVY